MFAAYQSFVICLLFCLVFPFHGQTQVTPSKPFPFRSMHLDVARHFFSVEVVKQYIDSLSKYNYNYFHWHLTDDQGWRIEIKAYPLLTKVGAWRKEKDGATYGGFYTQEDIKAIVNYAQQKNIEIIPEIDLPGHFSAAIAAYPWLSCHNKKIDVPKKHGIYHTILCPTDTVTQFVKTILDEVCELFPGQYIHLGGDEVPKSSWQGNPTVLKIKKEQQLKSLHAVQNYWMEQLMHYLKPKGKRVIVWGDVTRAPFSKDFIVMSWFDKKAGIKAARQGNQVIMAARYYCYFDYPKSRKDKKPVFYYPYLTNAKVARYTPYSPQLSPEAAKNIIGGAGMLWTEFVPTEQQLWYQFSPRVGTLGKALSKGYRY